MIKSPSLERFLFCWKFSMDFPNNFSLECKFPVFTINLFPCLFDVIIYHRTSQCPLCNKRFMARHSGPLHLALEDVSPCASPSSNESEKTALRARSKSVNYNCHVRISREIDTEPSVHAPVVIEPSVVHSTDEPEKNSNHTSNKTRTERKRRRDVGGGDGERKSKRTKFGTNRFNVAVVKCSVCYREYRGDVAHQFSTEPIACSFACMRFNACIPWCIQNKSYSIRAIIDFPSNLLSKSMIESHSIQ